MGVDSTFASPSAEWLAALDAVETGLGGGAAVPPAAAVDRPGSRNSSGSRGSRSSRVSAVSAVVTSAAVAMTEAGMPARVAAALAEAGIRVSAVARRTTEQVLELAREAVATPLTSGVSPKE